MLLKEKENGVEGANNKYHINSGIDSILQKSNKGRQKTIRGGCVKEMKIIAKEQTSNWTWTGNI